MDVRGAAADRARERYSDGGNCAQSVFVALADVPGAPEIPESFGGGFTTGIGGNGCVCGALAAGVFVLGEHATRQGLEPGAARQLAEEMSTALYDEFRERFGGTCCRVLKRGQTEGSDEWMSDCVRISEETAQIAAGLMADRVEGRPKRNFRDMMSDARRAGLGVLAAASLALLVALVVPVAAATVFPLVALALGVVAVAAEFVGPGGRKVGRVLRAIGTASAAVAACVVLFAPQNAEVVLSAVLSDGGFVLIARVFIAVATLVVAATSVFVLKRYR